MTTVRHFDRFVLKPLHLIFIAAAVAFLIGRLWPWLAGAVFGSFYLGVIGAKLHPHQSFSDLASGPTTSPAALKEEVSLTPLEHRALLGRACTRVGILVGVFVGIVLYGMMGWRWYFASMIGFMSMLLSGALLKVTFKTG
jgi:hypothetical protein